MAFSPDDKQLAVFGSEAPAPVLIDLNSARVQEKMTGGGHRGEVSSTVFAPNGTRLVTGGNRDGQAIVWDTQTGRPIRHLQDPTTNEQQAITFAVTVGWSPDGSTVATGGGQGRIFLWQTTDWRQRGTLPPTPATSGVRRSPPTAPGLPRAVSAKDRSRSGMSPAASWWAGYHIPTSSPR
jgi:WD40 repeat protein